LHKIKQNFVGLTSSQTASIELALHRFNKSIAIAPFQLKTFLSCFPQLYSADDSVSSRLNQIFFPLASEKRVKRLEVSSMKNLFVSTRGKIDRLS
jgi:hypothetical protein